MNSLAKLLLVSSRAARCVGPKILKPRRVNSSTTPIDSEISGPTTVKSGWIWCATESRLARLLGSPGMHVASSQIPPFPGRQYTCDTRGDWRSFHTSACSLPPPPITRTFIDKVVPENVPRADQRGYSIQPLFVSTRSEPSCKYFRLKPCLTLPALTALLRWTRSKGP